MSNINGCAVLVVMNPSGLVSTMFTVMGTSTVDGLNSVNSTAQVKVTLDPKGGIGLGMLLDSITEADGSETVKLYIILKQCAYIAQVKITLL